MAKPGHKANGQFAKGHGKIKKRSKKRTSKKRSRKAAGGAVSAATANKIIKMSQRAKKR